MPPFRYFGHRILRSAVCGAVVLLATADAGAFPFGGVFDFVYELVNDDTGDYVFVSRDEFFSVLQGSAGAGWRRTGYEFGYVVDRGIGGPDPSKRVPVCRFYAAKTKSHFFTANPEECAGLRAAPESGWHYEGVRFTSAPAVSGACPSGTYAINRLYRDGGRSYRYVFDADLRERMLREGWVDDGLALCEDIYIREVENDFVELANDAIGQYMWLAGAELLAVEQGSAGPGWRRTGYRFGDFGAGLGVLLGSPYPFNTGVCRFYASQTNAHFFTASADECNGLRAAVNSGWQYEGIAFRSIAPRNGACPSSTTAVHRLYRDGGHSYRYVFDADLRARMIREGWTDDGAVFCEEFAFRD